MRSWLQERAERGDIDLFVPYRFSSCFLHQRFGIRLASAAATSSCQTLWSRFDVSLRRNGGVVHGTRKASAVEANGSRIAIEFHAEGSLEAFAASVLPVLSPIRERYVHAGGHVIAFVLLRQPIQHLISSYRMWPPCAADREHTACRLARSFAAFSQGAAGAQAGRLALSDRPAGRTATRFRRRTGMSVDAPCEPLVQAAQDTLRRVDLVAPTDCLDSLLRTLAARVGFSYHRPSRRVPAALDYPMNVRLAARRASRMSALGADDRARVHAAAQCDQRLYSLAVRRAKTELAYGCAAALPPDRDWGVAPSFIQRTWLGVAAALCRLDRMHSGTGTHALGLANALVARTHGGDCQALANRTLP